MMVTHKLSFVFFFSKSWSCLLALLLLAQEHREVLGKPKTTARHLQIVNESGRRVDAFWVNSDTGELVRQTEPFIYNGGSLPLQSYVGHTFELRELPSSKTGKCGDPDDEVTIGICRMGTFTVNENDLQTIFIRKGMVIDHQDDKNRARTDASKAISACHDKAKESIAEADQVTPEFLSATYEELMSCVEKSVATKLQQVQDEVDFQANLRKSMGEIIANYTCNDGTLKTTEAASTNYWNDPTSKDRKRIDVLLDVDSAQVHYIHNFISTEECDAILQAAHFQADSSGSQQPSSSNMSEDASTTLQGLQASSARIPSSTDDTDLLSAFRQRVLNYAEHFFTTQDLQQDDFVTAIRFAKGDYWQPHCDGKCTGNAHVPGERVATIIAYCKTPQKGGSTNFRNAGVTIVPKPNAAVFFTYVAIADGETDKGYTEYSTCPVLEGEQEIVIQWIQK